MKDHKYYYQHFTDDISKFNNLKIVPKRVYLKEETGKFEILDLIAKGGKEYVE